MIERVLETHFHADFLSGHLELAAATGATISFGDEARADFPIDPLEHGRRMSLGDVTLEIRHTPGHTPESISVVVFEHADDTEPWGVLTGDALFIGDVGRPDLLTSTGWTADDLARRLYRSVHDQLLSLPDATRVFPAHGAGSACGKNLSTASESTIGEQRRTNYALAPMSEDDFVEAVTQGQSVAPLYFAFAADSNRRARGLLDDRGETSRLDIDRVLQLQRDGAVIIDARPSDVFASGHLRGSVNVGLDGRFAEYAGDVLRPGQAVVIVAEPGREHEARIRLARIGFDQCRRRTPRRRRRARRASRPRGARDARHRCAARRMASDRSTTSRSSTSAIRTSAPTASSTAPATCRCRTSSIGSASSIRRARRSCTAPVATGPPRPHPCCGCSASPRSPTCTAGTPPSGAGADGRGRQRRRRRRILSAGIDSPPAAAGSRVPTVR